MKKKFCLWVSNNASTLNPRLQFIMIMLSFIITLTSASIFIYNPPKNEDYENLAKTTAVFLNDFDNVYDLENATIDISENNISVKVSSDNCALTSFFNKDKTYLYSKRSDLSIPYSMLVIISALLSVPIGYLLYFIFMAICIIIRSIFKKSN